MLVVAFVQVDLIWPNFRSYNSWITGVQGLHTPFFNRIAGRCFVIAARDKYPSFRSFESYAVRQFVAHDHFYPVGVQGFGLENTVYVPQSFGREFGLAPHFNRAGVFHVHSPVRGIDVMRSPAGDHAGAELLAAQPAGTAVVLLRMNSFLRI